MVNLDGDRGRRKKKNTWISVNILVLVFGGRFNNILFYY